MLDKVEMLERLSTMWQAGTLSDREFEIEKAALLSELGCGAPCDAYSGENRHVFEVKRWSRLFKSPKIIGAFAAMAALTAVAMMVLPLAKTGGDESTQLFSSTAPTESSSVSANEPQANTKAANSDEGPSLQEMVANDPDAAAFTCMSAQHFFVAGDGMQLMMRYAPDMGSDFSTRLQYMAQKFMLLEHSLAQSKPGIDWEARAQTFSYKVSSTIHSRADLMPLAQLAWICSEQ